MNAGDHVPFGMLLRRFRLASGVTQATLAGRAGLSERAVNDLERDLKRLPRLETVTLLGRSPRTLARATRATIGGSTARNTARDAANRHVAVGAIACAG